MSFSLVWFAAQGIDKDAFLERAQFEDTGEVDEYFEHDHSGGELPDGWYVILSSEMGCWSRRSWRSGRQGRGWLRWRSTRAR